MFLKSFLFSSFERDKPGILCWEGIRVMGFSSNVCNQNGLFRYGYFQVILIPNCGFKVVNRRDLR